MNHEKCRRCRYSYLVDLGENGDMLRACVYIAKTGVRRPCPAGPGCTVWEPREEKKKMRLRFGEMAGR